MSFSDEIQSYFPPQPVIQPLPESDTSSPTHHRTKSLPDHKQTHYRPPTPPFPQNAQSTAANNHIPKQNSRTKPSRQAYAQLLSRLNEGQEQDDIRSHLGSRSRSRSRSDSSDASILPSILRLLAHETARADAAERELTRDAGALIVRVRDAKEAKERSEAELAHVKVELGLYKAQLEVAQREINRAQVIVADVERARVEAEDRGIRDRSRIRKLINERAIQIAREEGRKEGWKEGLERGRWMAWVEERNREWETDFDEEERRPETSQPSSSSHTSSTNTRTRPGERQSTRGSRRSEATRGVTPQNVPNLVAPIPIHPGAQRHPRRPASNPMASSLPVHLPEDISVQGQTRPRTRSGPEPRAPSPTATDYSQPGRRSPSLAPSRRSHRSINLPPDGYIPTLGPDELISLPPPHELSLPVELIASVGEQAGTTSNESRRRETETEGGRKSFSRKRETEPRREPTNTPRVRDYAYGSFSRQYDEGIRDYEDVFRERRNGRTPAMSATSRGSTRISQYDLVSPPKDREREREWTSRRNNAYRGGSDEQRGDGPTQAGTAAHTRRRTQPEQIVEEWRSANSDIVGTPTPAHVQPPGRTTSAMGSIYSMARPGTATEDSANRHMGRSSPQISSPRARGGPHLRRDETSTPNHTGNIPRTYSIYKDRPVPRNYGAQQSTAHRPQVEQGHTSNRADQPSQGTEQNPQNLTGRPRNPFERSSSYATVIDIAIEPPSHSPTNSSGTVVDPVLLTPDHANRPTSLPSSLITEPYEPPSAMHPGQQQGPNPVAVVLPDRNFPPGFVPLSPIPSLTNFNPVDHDHHRMHEQFRDAGYQIYAGAALIPHSPAPRTGTGAPMSQGSALFSDSRPSTAAGVRSKPVPRENTRRMASPAPLNRPISIFSDS